MNQQTIQLVQDSFAQVVPIVDQAAATFYAKIFEKDPELKTLFHRDMKQQGKKLMSVIGVAVDGLGDLESIVPSIQALGQRHFDYGVQDHHYDTVGEAFLETLAEGLGELFTEELEAAWTEIYQLLADVMKDAAANITTSTLEEPT